LIRFIFSSRQSSQRDAIYNTLSAANRDQKIQLCTYTISSFLLLSPLIIEQTNKIHHASSRKMTPSIIVHILEGDLYSRDQKKAFTIQNHEGITNEGAKTSKNRSVGPEGVQ
jgi:hypothetical protein